MVRAVVLFPVEQFIAEIRDGSGVDFARVIVEPFNCLFDKLSDCELILSEVCDCVKEHSDSLAGDSAILVRIDRIINTMFSCGRCGHCLLSYKL